MSNESEILLPQSRVLQQLCRLQGPHGAVLRQLKALAEV